MMDDNAAAAARFPVGKRFGDWTVLKKIDEGGFGQVYRVENVVTKKIAALKAEPTEIEGGSALKLEMAVIRAITADGEKPHVPLVFHAAKRKRFCYMIMTLLGENLKELKMHCPRENMSAQTWSRIGIQCLYSVKLVHDYGFVHRDIKPNNFVMGYREDYERARLVHILDFGLSRSYAVQSKGDKWIARRARSTAEFRGTLRYCSPNVHEKKEQGRRDDLWSLYYVLIELHCGLPWQTLRDKQKVELVKMHISDKDLVLNFPVELHDIIPYLRTLDYYQRPDYSMFYNGLVAVMKRVGAKATDPYDWEEPEAVKHIQKQLKGPYAWENSADFFKADPIQVNSPPPPKQRLRKEIDKLVKLVPLDENTRKDHSEATTASTDADKGSVPSEQTMLESRDKLSLIRGENNLLGPESILQQSLPTNFSTLLENQLPSRKRKDEDEINIQIKKGRIINEICNATSRHNDKNPIKTPGADNNVLKKEKSTMKAESKSKEKHEKLSKTRDGAKSKTAKKGKSTSKCRQK